MQEQQRAMVQQVMLKLTSVSFDQCVSKPSTSLSCKHLYLASSAPKTPIPLAASEKSCIRAVAGKQLEASQFIVDRLQRGSR